MKKILFAALVACFSMNASAQIAVEVMTDPFSGFTFQGAKVRYFLDESSAVRATISFGTNSTTTNPTTNFGPGTNLVVPTAENLPFLTYPGAYTLDQAKAQFDIEKDNFRKVTNTSFSLKLGYEKILANVGKASFYAGGDLYFGKDWAKTYSETAAINATGAVPVKAATETDKETSSTTYLGLTGFGGIDYDITDNLYLGVECGLNILYTAASNKTLEGENWTGTALQKITNEAEVKNNTLRVRLAMVPALRIGWKF